MTVATKSKSGFQTEQLDEKMDYMELKDFVEEVWREKSDESTEYEVEKTALRGNSVAYSILNRRDVESGQESKLIGVVVLNQLKNEDGYELTYQALTENESPQQFGCPPLYLKRTGGVSGAPTTKARNWRKKVVDYNEKEKKLRDIKESGEMVEVQYGTNTFNVSFNEEHRRWVVKGESKYIPSKYVTPETVKI